MSDILMTKKAAPTATQSGSNKKKLFFTLAGNLASIDELGNIDTYSTGVTPEEVQDIIGNDTIIDSAEILKNYNDAANNLSFSIASLSINTGKIADNAITSAKILDNAITTSKINNDAVTTLKILDANVTTSKIADNAITSAKILNDAVTSLKILNDAITTSKILNSNVTNAKLADMPANTFKARQGSTGVAEDITVSQAKILLAIENVNNTSDANKPISTATQVALDAKYNASNPNGYETPTQLNARDTANRSRTNHTGTQLANTISDFADTVRNTVLTGITFLTNSAILATDSILVAFGKIQAQINAHFGAGGTAHALATTTVAGFMSALDKIKLDGLNNDVALVTATQLNNASNVTFTQITDHTINVVAGRIYSFEILLRYQTAATTTGIVLSMGGTATGVLAANAHAMVATGTAGLFSGPLTALNGVLTSTGVPAANTPYLARITGIFQATSNGTIFPQFRSEVNGSNVSVLADSVTSYKDLP